MSTTGLYNLCTFSKVCKVLGKNIYLNRKLVKMNFTDMKSKSYKTAYSNWKNKKYFYTHSKKLFAFT